VDEASPVSPPLPVARFGPDRRYTWCALGGLVVALGLVVLTTDRPGCLLFALAAALLLGYVVTDLIFAPRLTVSAAGVVVNSPLTRATLGWAEVEDVRADSRTRFGLRSTTLEVDAGPVLAVLSRRALAADPADVAELVRAFRPVP
jgi:hypothetical protein